MTFKCNNDKLTITNLRLGKAVLIVQTQVWNAKIVRVPCTRCLQNQRAPESNLTLGDMHDTLNFKAWFTYHFTVLQLLIMDY